MPPLSRTRTIICRSARATAALGRAVGNVVPNGVTLGLQGELGSGKTTFTQGFLSAFKIHRGTSPTFVLVKEIPVHFRGIHRILHADLYRLAAHSDITETGLTDTAGKPGTVTIIEWANRLSKKPKNLHVIRFRIPRPHTRTVQLSATVSRWLTRKPALRAAAVARPLPQHSRHYPRPRASSQSNGQPASGR